jgi:hypothetical protein
MEVFYLLYLCPSEHQLAMQVLSREDVNHGQSKHLRHEYWTIYIIKCNKQNSELIAFLASLLILNVKTSSTRNQPRLCAEA